MHLPLEALQRMPRVLLPRPYPLFLPYWFDGPASEFSLEDVEAVEFSIDGRMDPNERDAAHGYEIERVMLVGA